MKFLSSLIIVFIFQSVLISQQLFKNFTDIGKIKHKGILNFDSTENIYRITGSGENIWGSEDAFFYIWEKALGDLKMQADIDWIGEGHHPHRKAGLMIRTGLNNDDPYVDAVIHGDGLISLQFRKVKGGETSEIKSLLKPPATLLLERTGNEFTLTLIKWKEYFPVGTITINFDDSVYAGLVVCSHNSNTTETALFKNVQFVQLGIAKEDERIVESTLEIFDMETMSRKILYRSNEHFEAPNWSPDNKFIYFNQNGKIYRISINGGEPELVNTDFADRCNNDHGFSRDGKSFAVSSHSQDGKSRIFILPSEGGKPKLITENGPSYWHGWSPDGKNLCYCAERNGEFDVYTISIDSKNEKRLTDAAGLDDGPEYSPDGNFIYFNSVRTGKSKIWRMNSDGSNQIQITYDEFNDWFPHPSPNSKWILFLSYNPDVEGHPANKNVYIRILSLADNKIETLATLFGGQGTINVPSWSPNSKKFAFVSYRLIKSR